MIVLDDYRSSPYHGAPSLVIGGSPQFKKRSRKHLESPSTPICAPRLSIWRDAGGERLEAGTDPRMAISSRRGMGTKQINEPPSRSVSNLISCLSDYFLQLGNSIIAEEGEISVGLLVGFGRDYFLFAFDQSTSNATDVVSPGFGL